MIVIVVAALLATAAALAVLRMVRGPAVLDRVVAMEALLSVIICALGAEAALFGHATTLPVLVALAMLGFIGSVALVRFMVGEEA